MKFRWWLVLLTVCVGTAEIIDRVAVTVGNRAITASELEWQMRMAAFVDGKKLDFSPEEKRKAAERLIEQALVQREMELSQYPRPELPEAKAMLDQLRKDERLQSEAAYKAELKRYGITEEELLRYLLLQLTTVRFIDFRFRGSAQVPEADLRAYYEKEYMPGWRKNSSEPPPDFEESREEIENILLSQAADEALDRWLKQARQQARIRIHAEAVPPPAAAGGAR